MKIDPYKHKERYEKWREEAKTKGVSGVSKENSELILQYLDDMYYGLNISTSSTKGGRGPARLNTLKGKMIFFSEKFKELYELNNIIEINEIQLHKLFSMMRKGEILTKRGKRFTSTGDYVKTFKAFWHWHIKIHKKKGIEITDITEDLDSREDKPKWVYLDEKQLKLLCGQAKHKYKVLMMFLLDTGIRAPTELMNIKILDLYNDCKEVNIRNEISKTFGRRIKLMLSSDLIRDFIKNEELQDDDYLFQIAPSATNRYLQRLALKIFGEEVSPAGEKYCNLTMYDFRHIACCYWLPRYKSESALKYRFGWKKSDKIHYYSEMLGMSDTIAEDDMFIDVTKTELEQKLEVSESARDILQERVAVLEGQMRKVLEMIEGREFLKNQRN
jgi:hypothetical protein